MAAPILDEETLVRAFETHGPSMSAIGAAWVGRFDVPDLLQETARVAWQRRAQFSIGTDLRAWLLQIVRHVGANWRRRRRAETFEHLDVVDPRQATPGEGAFDAEHLGLPDELARGLAGLSPTARECLLLRVVVGHTYPEIAGLLGVPENTVQSHVRRARSALRAALEADTTDVSGRVIPMPRSEPS